MMRRSLAASGTFAGVGGGWASHGVNGVNRVFSRVVDGWIEHF